MAAASVLVRAAANLVERVASPRSLLQKRESPLDGELCRVEWSHPHSRSVPVGTKVTAKISVSIYNSYNRIKCNAFTCFHS